MRFGRGLQRLFFAEAGGVHADRVDRRDRRRAARIERVQRLRFGDEALHDFIAAGGVALADDVVGVGELDEARVPADLAEHGGHFGGRRPRVQFAAEHEHGQRGGQQRRARHHRRLRVARRGPAQAGGVGLGVLVLFEPFLGAEGREGAGREGGLGGAQFALALQRAGVHVE